MATELHIEHASKKDRTTAGPSASISNDAIVPATLMGLDLDELNNLDNGTRKAVVFRAMQRVDERVTSEDDRVMLYQMIFGIDDHTHPTGRKAERRKRRDQA